MMRHAITQCLDREEQREIFRQETLKAWEEYRATGLYAPANEGEDWLASWGTDHELPPPRCHE